MLHESGVAERIERRNAAANAVDVLRFIGSFIAAPRRTGAQWPSGPALCHAMAAAVDLDLPGTIVELGPGTGVVTEALLARAIAPERLALIEASPAFCKLLRPRFPEVSLIEGNAFDFAKIVAERKLGPVAAVVSSLPLLTQPHLRRLDLLRMAFSCMHPEGVFIQFTYGLRSPIPVIDRFVAADVTPRIWRNIWPACVWQYRRIHRPGGRSNGHG
jgi:phosphatidylethanolamine/phosphatidyl-N-methylethanolamine N-methyltransferase